MTLKGATKLISEIGRELGVTYVLEGSVRREGGRVRISAQLIDARDQDHVWADSYDEELADILRAQRRVAEAVAHAIQVEFGPTAKAPGMIRSLDPEAHSAYLRGRYLYNRRTANGFREAIDAFEEAIEREPEYAPAHVGLARCCAAFFLGLLPRAEAQPRARAAIERALDLDDRLAEAHAVFGSFRSMEGDYPVAERAFRRALTLDPNDATAHHWYAMQYLLDMGQFQEALDELDRARILDPLALVVSADVGAVLYLMREPKRAVEQCRRVLELDPNFARAHLYAGWALASEGALDEALTELETAKRLNDSPWVSGWLGYTYGRIGRRAEAERILAKLREISLRGHEVAYFEALVHAGLGETAHALDSLGRACDERSISFSVARYVPAFDDLRSEPRFQKVVGDSPR
jgi:tetratricopeptide (TPR) repeat protein